MTDDALISSLMGESSSSADPFRLALQVERQRQMQNLQNDTEFQLANILSRGVGDALRTYAGSGAMDNAGAGESLALGLLGGLTNGFSRSYNTRRAQEVQSDLLGTAIQLQRAKRQQDLYDLANETAVKTRGTLLGQKGALVSGDMARALLGLEGGELTSTELDGLTSILAGRAGAESAATANARNRSDLNFARSIEQEKGIGGITGETIGREIVRQQILKQAERDVDRNVAAGAGNPAETFRADPVPENRSERVARDRLEILRNNPGMDINEASKEALRRGDAERTRNTDFLKDLKDKENKALQEFDSGIRIQEFSKKATGYGRPFQGAIEAYDYAARALGSDSAEERTSARSFLNGEVLALAKRGRTPGEGQMSDRDVAILIDMAKAGITSPEKAQFAGKLREIGAKRALDYADFAREWIDTYGTQRGLNNTWTDYVQANPLIFERDGNFVLNTRQQDWREFNLLSGSNELQVQKEKARRMQELERKASR